MPDRIGYVWIPVALALVGAFLAGRCSGDGLRPIPVGIAPTKEVDRGRPTVTPRLPERVLTGRVKPTQVVLGDQKAPERLLYCRQAPIAPQPAGQAPPLPDSRLLPDFSVRAGKRLQAWSTLSDATPYTATFPVKVDRGFSLLTSGDSIVVRQERWVTWAARKCLWGAALGIGVAAVAGETIERAAMIGGPLGCSARVALP